MVTQLPRFDKVLLRLIECAREETSQTDLRFEKEAPAWVSPTDVQSRRAEGPSTETPEGPKTGSPVTAPLGARATFGRSRRLTRRGDLQRVFREGKNLRAEWVILKVLKSGRTTCRFACTVRRGVARTAPARNRLKRWMREAFRRNQGQIPAGYDLVAVIIQQPPEAAYRCVEETFIRLSNQIQP